MGFKITESVTTQNQDHISKPIVQSNQNEEAIKIAESLVALQKKMGLRLTIKDKNLYKIDGCFNSIADLLRNPEFISRLSQELYISDHNESTWFKIKLKRGRFESIRFLLTTKVNWIKIFSNSTKGFYTRTNPDAFPIFSWRNSQRS